MSTSRMRRPPPDNAKFWHACECDGCGERVPISLSSLLRGEPPPTWVKIKDNDFHFCPLCLTESGLELGERKTEAEAA